MAKRDWSFIKHRPADPVAVYPKGEDAPGNVGVLCNEDINGILRQKASSGIKEAPT